MGLFCNCDANFKKLREEVLASLKNQNTKLDKIMKTQAELKTLLEAANDEVTKIRKEQKDAFAAEAALVKDLTEQVEALKKLIADGAATPGLEAAADKLLATIKEFDDEKPDAEPPPPVV